MNQSITNTRPNRVIQYKTLQYIANHLAGLCDRSDIIKFFGDCGVDDELIHEISQVSYSDQELIDTILNYLATSGDKDNKKCLASAIEKAVHPLMFGGDEQRAAQSKDKFNDLLKWDGLHLIRTDEALGRYQYHLTRIINDVSTIQSYPDPSKDPIDEQDGYERLIKGNKKEILTLKEGYALVINIIEVFRDAYPQIDQKLNRYYMQIMDYLDSLIVRSSFSIFFGSSDDLPRADSFALKDVYYKPFTNFYTAEADLERTNPVSFEPGINWNQLRKKLYNCMGQLDRVVYKYFPEEDVQEYPELFQVIRTYLHDLHPQGLITDLVELDKSDYERRTTREDVQVLITNTVPNWRDDFVEEDGKFCFGNYGSKKYKSKTRESIFRLLFEANGNWVKVSSITSIVEKDDDWVRVTINQMEKDLPIGLKEYISIPSTTEDATLKRPSTGAYRIKFIGPQVGETLTPSPSDSSIEESKLASKSS